MEAIFFSWRQAVLRSKLESTTKHVLITLGCHMNEMGESCFPSIETLCAETSLSNRAVITHLKKAEEAGFIRSSIHGYKGKKWAQKEYFATFPQTIKVVNVVHDLNEKVVNVVHEGSERGDMKVVNDVHTSTSINSSINTSTPRAHETAEPEKRFPTREGELACRLIPLGVAVTSMHPTLCQWVADGIDFDLIVQCVALARQYKPLPEKIAPNYLDRIIRDALVPKVDNTWLNSDDGVIAKGREVGCPPRTGESMLDYRTRLKAFVHGSGKRVA